MPADAFAGCEVLTGRMNSRAVWPNERACEELSPGTVMTMLLPSITTSEPDTPRPLTRVSMMPCACWRLSRLGALPSGVRAVSVTRVPPCRSMPSLAVGDLSPVKKINAYTIATIAANSANRRPGCCIDPWDGATVGRSPRVRSRRRRFGSDLAGSLGDTRERAPADAGRACEGPRQVTRG